MLVFLDINEIWRRKPFAALAEQTDVLGVAPADWMVAHKRGFQSLEREDDVLNVVLPPGWASRTAWLGQRMLWRKLMAHCRWAGKTITGLMVTSPHYLPLLDLVPDDLPTFYYASDDYRSYEGWGAVIDMEKQLVERVDHAFFISAGLMERAQKEYGVDAGKLSVSPNATEPRFFPGKEELPLDPPEGELKRPVAGIIGGINERMDFGLLRKCADLPDLGTVLLVGPLPAEPDGALKELLDHPKCVAVGRQPHGSIHRWFQCLDVGLIPYVATEFNRFCSPMRLYDQLATGAPIVATDACEQVSGFGEQVAVGASDTDFIQALEQRLTNLSARFRAEDILWADRARAIRYKIEEYTSA